MHVPYFRPDIGDEDVQAVTNVLRSGWLTTGAVAREFEQKFCEATGARYAVAVNSCTSGLHAALVAAGIGSGDEVITTPLTYCATVRAIEESGAKPIFVDIADDLNLNCNLIEQVITSRTRGLLPVHLAGLPCDMEAIWQLARKHRLAVIEDAAHAFGTSWRARQIGSSDFSTAVFSFYANKNLTTGEGGMITTANADHAAKLRLLVGSGIQRTSDNAAGRWQYEAVERGFKYNLSDVLAAIGVAQIKKAAQHASEREKISRHYVDALSNVPEIELPTRPLHVRHAWHLFIIRLRLEKLTICRDEFLARLADRGVECSVHFRPIPMHRWFAHYGPMRLWPKTQAEFPRLLSLPIYPGLSEQEREYVAEQLRDLIAASRRRVFAVRASA